MPQVFRQIDACAHQARIPLEEALGQGEPEWFGSVDGLERRKRVDGILHRVGRQNGFVVAVRVDLVIMPLELDRDGEISEVVAIAMTADLNEPHRRLAIRRVNEHAGY